MALVAYEDAEIQVLFHQGSSDYLIVTFGDLTKMADGNAFFAAGPVLNRDITCLAFMPKAIHWYPADAVQRSVDDVRHILDRYDDRVLYGGSMGAYAAIKFSKLLRASTVIALCPQWSIDPAECGAHESGYRHFFREHMTGMGVRPDDVAGDVFVFSDPFYDDDEFHRSSLARQCQLYSIPMISVGHSVTGVVAGTDNLFDIIASCRSRNVSRLKRIINSLRHGNPFRVAETLRRLSRRHPKLVCQLLHAKQLDQSAFERFFYIHEAYEFALRLAALGMYDLSDRLAQMLNKRADAHVLPRVARLLDVDGISVEGTSWADIGVKIDWRRFIGAIARDLWDDFDVASRLQMARDAAEECRRRQRGHEIDGARRAFHACLDHTAETKQ